jgi:hypothetical protein
VKEPTIAADGARQSRPSLRDRGRHAARRPRDRGLLTAGSFSRSYALGAGLLLTALGVWGLALAPGDAILGFLPAAGGDEALNLTLGILGLLAGAGTPRRLEPVADAGG